MGGNALAHVGVKRINTNDMIKVQNELRELFDDFLIIDFVPFIRDKTDHGDIDVLVQSKTNESVKNILTSLLLLVGVI